MLPWTHPSPYSERHLDRFSRFCTAHSRRSLYFTMGHLSPSKLPLRMGDLDPHLIHASLQPPRSASRTAPQLVQPFLHSSRQKSPILYNGPPLFSSSLPLCMRSEPPSNTWFLGPTRVHNSNSISICSAVFAGLTIVTEERPHSPSVTTGRIYVCSTAMRPKNSSNNNQTCDGVWTRVFWQYNQLVKCLSMAH